MRRMTRTESWSYFEHTLANTEVAEEGHMACLDTATALIVAGQPSTTLRPIGYFDEDLTGDGAKQVRVLLFRELQLHWWDNDVAPNDVQAADIGNDAFILDSRTVSASDGTATRSTAGTVWAVHSIYGVLIEHP